MQRSYIVYEKMPLGETKGQPAAHEQIQTPLILKSRGLIQPLGRQGLLTQILHLDLTCVMINPQQGIRIAHAFIGKWKTVGQTNERCVGRLLNDPQVQILMVGSAGAMFALQTPELGDQVMQMPVVFFT